MRTLRVILLLLLAACAARAATNTVVVTFGEPTPEQRAAWKRDIDAYNLQEATNQQRRATEEAELGTAPDRDALLAAIRTLQAEVNGLAQLVRALHPSPTVTNATAVIIKSPAEFKQAMQANLP